MPRKTRVKKGILQRRHARLGFNWRGRSRELKVYPTIPPLECEERTERRKRKKKIRKKRRKKKRGRGIVKFESGREVL